MKDYEATTMTEREELLPSPHGFRPFTTRTTRVVSLALALAATTTSLGVCVLAGWERGAGLAERLVWIAIGAVLMLSAHLIPALVRAAPVSMRLFGLAIWAVAMVCTGYSHGTFFLSAQRHAGDLRAASISTPSSSVIAVRKGPGIGEIALMRSQVEQQLANANAAKCERNCGWLQLRRENLTSRLTALNIQLDEARRDEASAEVSRAAAAALVAHRDEQRADPVTLQLARLIHVPEGSVDLGIALIFGWLLEGIACVSWMLALARNSEGALASRHCPVKIVTESAAPSSPLAIKSAANDDDVEDVTAKLPVTTTRASDPPEIAEACGVRTEPEVTSRLPKEIAPQPRRADTVAKIRPRHDQTGRDELDRLTEAIIEGHTTSSVRDIRAYLECSEGRALALRRQLSSVRPELLCLQAVQA
jgi:hypothetical protein